MRFILDGGSVGSRQALHQTLAAGPTELVIRNGRALDEAMGDQAAALRRVLADCAAESEWFTVAWEE